MVLFSTKIYVCVMMSVRDMHLEIVQHIQSEKIAKNTHTHTHNNVQTKPEHNTRKTYKHTILMIGRASCNVLGHSPYNEENY